MIQYYPMDYRWTETDSIKQKLTQIEALRLVIKNYPSDPTVLANLRRRNLLKSAVFSARVENISAHIDDPGVHRKLEIQNLLAAYKLNTKRFDLLFIKNIHKQVLKNISQSAGSFRTEPWAIYNQAGIAVYLAPLHTKIPDLMTSFVSYINSLQLPVPIISAIAQFIFEKIHPFADGNGRVGRIISSHILNANGYDLSGLSVFEEYTDDHRDLYYESLTPNKDMTSFIEYFLDSIIVSVQTSLDTLKNQSTRPVNSLLPRRQEIINIISDHPQCSFDFLHRRFASVPKSSLHNDLQYLQKKNLITKHGVSRGAVYSVSKNFPSL